MKDIQESILKKFPEMSKNQKKLANFILENLETISLLSVKDIAKSTNVSTASIVRFTRLLDFDGYLDFRNHLGSKLKEKLSPLERIKSTFNHKDELQNSFDKVASQVISNINETLLINASTDFTHVVSHLRNSQSVFCLGMGVSHFMAEIFAYLLKLNMKKAFAISGDSPTYHEQIILLSEKDLIVFFSFPPYSQETIDAAKFASDQHIPIITFTDKVTSPIVQYSEHVLIAKTDNYLFTNSLGAISVVMNALFTEMALTEDKKVLEGMAKIESFLKDSRYFVQDA